MGAHRQGGRPPVGAGPLTGGPPDPAATGASGDAAPAPRVVRVLPDVPAIDKQFDYLVPDDLGDQVRVGTRVRIDLHGRRVGGWVVADQVIAPPGVRLRPIGKVTGWGPQPDLLELAGWAAWRWAGRPASLLRTASPERAAAHLPARPTRPRAVPGPTHPLGVEAVAAGTGVVRLPPTADMLPVVRAAVARGDTLVVTPSVSGARHLALRLRRAGVEVASVPEQWEQARAGGRTVVGARAAAWAPVPDLAAVVVVDEHDEALQEERAPTWHARDVAVERARRAGVPCVLVSPCPSLEAQSWGRVLTPSRQEERAGWPVLQVVDLRREDPARTGLWSEPLVAAMRRTTGRIVCVLNRRGRSRLLACRSCRELARCHECASAVVQDAQGRLVCHRCGAERPALCLACGATTFRNLRLGVTRAREELAALLAEPVAEITGGRDVADDTDPARVVVGTEAALHQVPEAELVAFLDIDQELLAPRYRAAEEALALLVRGARLVGPRAGGGRLVAQTRLPRHEVLVAAVQADPGRVSEAEADRRRALDWPPFAALAEVSGVAAEAFVEGLAGTLGITLLGPLDGRWLVRAPDAATLADALAAVPRPPGRLRVAVDPLRI